MSLVQIYQAFTEEAKRKFITNREKFLKLLNKIPPASKIFKHPFAPKNKKGERPLYLKIGYLEMQLDKIFSGLWETRILDTQFIGNSVCVQIELRVFLPDAGIWISRAGSGACTVQRGKKTGELLEKTLESVFPKAKSEAFKNACKSLGISFGRGLNRDHEDYTTIYTNAMDMQGAIPKEIKQADNVEIKSNPSPDPEIQDALDTVQVMVNSCTTLQELETRWRQNTHWHNDDDNEFVSKILEMFSARKKELAFPKKKKS